MSFRTWLIDKLDGVTWEHHEESLAKERLRATEREYRAEQSLASVTKLIDKTPADCNRGRWCKACAFGKRSAITVGVGHNTRVHEVVYCMKGESCKHFKEGANDET